MEKIEYYKKLLKERLSKKRYHHSVCVMEQSVRLAGAWGQDEEKAAIAGLLHDICKEMPDGEQLQYLSAHDILVDNFTKANPRALHGITAGVWLREELDIDDEEILGAVTWHTLGKANMAPLEEIVFLADWTSDDRDFPDADRIRKLLPGKKDEAVWLGLSFGLSTVISEELPLIPSSVEGYNDYLYRSKKCER
ncbi:MAG: bis(5'-nucleosyl)-tetraphosphatase (symmetrical) YqeK [Oscillospiraceae bacterium]